MCVDTVNTHVGTNIPAEGCFESPLQRMGNVHGRCWEATRCLVHIVMLEMVPHQEELHGTA